MIREYLNKLSALTISDYERDAISKIYRVFKDYPAVDSEGTRLVSEPLYILRAIRSDSAILDNIDDIIFKLNYDVKKHFDFLAQGVPTKFWGVTEWLFKRGWTSNEYRKEKSYYTTKWFGVRTAKWQRKMETPDKRKEAEIKLKLQNKEKHERMLKIVRERRYQND